LATTAVNTKRQPKKNHLAVVFFVQAKITWRLPKQVLRVQQPTRQLRVQQRVRVQQREQLLLFYRKQPKQQQR